jgi:hypothetical protein
VRKSAETSLGVERTPWVKPAIARGWFDAIAAQDFLQQGNDVVVASVLIERTCDGTGRRVKGSAVQATSPGDTGLDLSSIWGSQMSAYLVVNRWFAARVLAAPRRIFLSHFGGALHPRSSRK